MAKFASKVVEQAKAWLGCNEYDGTHKKIIDVYNSHKPLARCYPVKYTDAWCATFVSAVAIKLGYTDIIPTECGCPQMIDLFKKLGAWIENENRTPNPGEIVFYDWEDSGIGDNLGCSDHVGIVEKVSGGKITVIEGNYSNSVKRRTLAVNGRYIRGYGVPKYDKEAAPEADGSHENGETTADEYKPTVKEWQKAAIADGFKFPKYGADGVWGAECVSVAQKAIVRRRIFYTNKNLTRLVQRVVGVSVDGLCGKNTDAAIKAYQKAHGLSADGQVGLNTWKKILNIR